MYNLVVTKYSLSADNMGNCMGTENLFGELGLDLANCSEDSGATCLVVATC